MSLTSEQWCAPCEAARAYQLQVAPYWVHATDRDVQGDIAWIAEWHERCVGCSCPHRVEL